jgi:hypothetical protein
MHEINISKDNVELSNVRIKMLRKGKSGERTGR